MFTNVFTNVPHVIFYVFVYFMSDSILVCVVSFYRFTAVYVIGLYRIIFIFHTKKASYSQNNFYHMDSAGHKAAVKIDDE